MATVFLSYARGDDEPFVKRLYEDLTAHGFGVWFDRVSMPSRRLTFHQEIRDAIAGCDRLVLVVGPRAAVSDYVRQEWQFAWFEAENVVTPILRVGDYPLVPDELKLLHCEDFRNDAEYAFHLEQLVGILREPPPPLGKLIAVPSLPAHFLSRSQALVKLRDAVRAGLDSPVPFGGAVARQHFHGISGTSKQLGMHGMGGIGKSVLAMALARDRTVREAFRDGIVWVGLGPVPALVDLQRRVHRDLGGDVAFATEHEGKHKLKDLLEDKAALLVIDDAWRRSDVDAFDVLGSRCRALVTTRDAGLLTALGGEHFVVELLTDAEALRLLAVAAGIEAEAFPAVAHDVLGECGKLPLAVALAGAMVRAGTPWRDVRDALREHELEFLENPHAASEHHVNLWRTIEVSVRFLSNDVQERLAELAVFPEDEQVPDAAVTTLWQNTGDLSPRQSRKVLVELKQRSLVQLTPSPETAADGLGLVSLHDLIHDYCVRRSQQMFGDAEALHTRLLDAYRRTCPGGWWTGANDGYFLTHLRNHLAAAQRVSELAALLHEFSWLQTKTRCGLVFDLTADFQTALDRLPDDRALRLLQGAVQLSAHVLARDSSQLPGQLLGRLLGQNTPELQGVLEQCKHCKDAAWLQPLIASLTPPGGPLLHTLAGHDYPVTAVAVTPDGRRLISASEDKTVKVWDLESGAQCLTLKGHHESVSAVVMTQWDTARRWTWPSMDKMVVTPDGRRLISASEDGALNVWDLATGAQCLTFTRDVGKIAAVAVTPDGRRLISACYDETGEFASHDLKVWDLESGAECLTLKGHDRSVTAVAVTPDGRRAISASHEGTLKVWDLESGAQCLTLKGHDELVTAVAVTPDGRRLISASHDATLKVWDLLSGAECLPLVGHDCEVTAVVVTPDGRRVISGSRDGTLKVWDFELVTAVAVMPDGRWAISAFGDCTLPPKGHDDEVSAVAVTPDGRRAISASEEGTLKVWDLASGAECLTLKGHGHAVNAVAVTPDGWRAISASEDGTLKVWDLQSGTECLTLFTKWGQSVRAVAVTPDGRRLISASYDWTRDFSSYDLEVWDLESGAQCLTLTGHGEPVTIVAVTPDGRRAISASEDGTLKVWDLESGTECLTLVTEMDLSVTAVVVTPDGRRAISGSADGTLKVWDLESGAQCLTLKGNDSSVTAMVMTPDGRRAVSASLDRTIKVWDVETGEVIASFSADAAVLACAVSSETIVAGDAQGRIHILRLEEP